MCQPLNPAGTYCGIESSALPFDDRCIKRGYVQFDYLGHGEMLPLWKILRWNGCLKDLASERIER